METNLVVVLEQSEFHLALKSRKFDLIICKTGPIFYKDALWQNHI
jgi:hypothetical protein